MEIVGREIKKRGEFKRQFERERDREKTRHIKATDI